MRSSSRSVLASITASLLAVMLVAVDMPTDPSAPAVES
jgi:hypothetical protein